MAKHKPSTNIPYPDASHIPQASARYGGKSLRLPLQPSAFTRLLGVILFLAVAGAVTIEIVSTFAQNGHLGHVILNQADIFFAALLKISMGTLEVSAVDSCPETEQGVFILDNSVSPPTTIVNNSYVPSTVNEFDLGNLVWSLPDGWLNITGNYTVIRGGDEFICCDPFANPIGTQCSCVWDTDDLAGRYELCGTRSLYSLNYSFCQMDLLSSQYLGVDTLSRSFDPTRHASSTFKLNVTHQQTIIDGTLTVNRDQQLVNSATELVPAYEHSGSMLYLSDVIGCPTGSCTAPDPFGYDLVVFQFIDKLGNPFQVDITSAQADTEYCLNTQLFPIDPNPYVQKPQPGADAKDVNSYLYNNLASELLSCGSSMPPTLFAATTTAANMFVNTAYVASPFFPIRKGATYKVEFGCTAINMHLEGDDDDLYAPASSCPGSPGDLSCETGKFQWCAHMYDMLADDDACTLPPPGIREEYLTYIGAQLALVDPAILGPELQNLVEKYQKLVNEFTANGDTASRSAVCCDMRYDSACFEPTPVTEKTIGNFLNTDIFHGEQPARKWNATAFQIYTICAGVSTVQSDYNTSPAGLAAEMFISVQRVNPMAWLTGSEGMTYDMEGHAYWSVNDKVLEDHTNFMGQCGVFTGATPFLFNSQQQVVDPSVSMEGVPGFEDVPYPGQVAGELPSINHMCNTQEAMLSNCYVRVRSYLPGSPEMVSSTSKKRESVLYEPSTGEVYWRGRQEDMAKADVWQSDIFRSKKDARNAKRKARELLRQTDREYNEEKRRKIQHQHQLNVEGMLKRARRPT